MRINNVEISEFSPEPGWFVAVYTEDYDLSISGYGSNRQEAFDNLVEALYDLDIQFYEENIEPMMN
jgi:SHS2 domain-containing protein